MKPAIAYVRVSTQQQGKSGLGLEAQRAAIEAFAKAEGLTLIEWQQDVESGSIDTRPGLEAALARARLLQSPVIVSKLDRLSRDAFFIFGLMNAKVEIIVTGIGRQSDPMMLHLHAVFAENERKKISERTKAALAAAKARGVKLGNPRLKPGTGSVEGIARAREVLKQQRASRKANDLLRESLGSASTVA